MRFEDFSFGSIRIDGITYEHDVVIDRGKIRKRKKKPSKKFRDDFGHTPLSVRKVFPGSAVAPFVDRVPAVQNAGLRLRHRQRFPHGTHLAREHLVEHRAQAEQIRPMICLEPTDVLG